MQLEGNIFLNFGDIKALEAPKAIKEASFISNFINQIDLLGLNQVLLNEGEDPNMFKPEWAFLSSTLKTRFFKEPI